MTSSIEDDVPVDALPADDEDEPFTRMDAWNGIFDSSLRWEEDIEILNALADTARNGDWTSLIDLLLRQLRLCPNDWCPDDPSFDTIMHRAARWGAPVDVIEQLIKLGGWRNIKNAQGERPIDIARRLHHDHLLSVLEPELVFDIPVETISALQSHFHNLIKKVIVDDGIDDEVKLVQVMPDLNVLLEQKDLKMWFEIHKMYGGFRYCLDPAKEKICLRVTCWSRVADIEDGYVVTPSGWAKQ